MLFEAVESLMYRTVLMCAYGAGLRLSEACCLRCRDPFEGRVLGPFQGGVQGRLQGHPPGAHPGDLPMEQPYELPYAFPRISLRGCLRPVLG